jgi:hypothetical protein
MNENEKKYNTIPTFEPIQTDNSQINNTTQLQSNENIDNGQLSNNIETPIIPINIPQIPNENNNQMTNNDTQLPSNNQTIDNSQVSNDTEQPILPINNIEQLNNNQMINNDIQLPGNNQTVDNSQVSNNNRPIDNVKTPDNQQSLNNQPINNIQNNNHSQSLTGNNKNKKIFIIIGAIILIFIIFKLLSSGTGGHKNTTGSTKYKDSDVALNCQREEKDSESTKTMYLDFVLNYDDGTTYQAAQFTKYVETHKETLTDDEYKELVDKVRISLYDVDYTKSHIEFDLSTFGFDTVIDRNGNTVEVTGYSVFGAGEKGTNNTKNTLKEEFEEQGYTCK